MVTENEEPDDLFPQSALGKSATGYLLKEQQQCRANIEAFIRRVEGDMRYGLLATGVYWSWLASHSTPEMPFPVLMAILPVAVSLLFFWRRSAFDKAIKRVARYIRRIERQIGLPEHLGWERYIVEVKKKEGANELAKSTDHWWVALIVVNLVFAVVYGISAIAHDGSRLKLKPNDQISLARPPDFLRRDRARTEF